MSTQQAYINGFVKRAAQYGYSHNQALGILKQAVSFPSNLVPNTPGSLAAPIATPLTGGQVPESLKPEFQSNPMAGMMSGSNLYSSPEPAPALSPGEVSSLLNSKGPAGVNPEAFSAKPSSPAAPAAQPSAGPSDAYLAKVMGSYDPKSRLDQAKASRIREMYSAGTTSPKDIYADKAYSGINSQSVRANASGANRPQLPRPTPSSPAGAAPTPAPSAGGASSLLNSKGPAGVNPGAFSGGQKLNFR